MTEDKEKYRKLYSLINDSSKKEVFGHSGIFSSTIDGNHKVFQLFAEWIYQKKVENKKLPDHLIINSDNFISQLRTKGEKDEDFKKTINDIYRLKGDKIKDIPPEENTLLQFAKALDEIGLFDNLDNLDNFSHLYNEALKILPTLPPIQEAKTSKVSQPQIASANKASPISAGNSAAASSTPAGMASSKGADFSGSSGSASGVTSEGSISSSEASLGIAAESSDSINISAESTESAKTTNQLAESIQSPPTQDLAQAQPQSARNFDQPLPDRVPAGFNRKGSFEPKNEGKSLPGQTDEEREISAAKFEEPNANKTFSIIQGRPGNRVLRMKGGRRKLHHLGKRNRPNRVKEKLNQANNAGQNSVRAQAQNQQSQELEQQYNQQNQLAQQQMMMQRLQEEQQAAENQRRNKKKGSFASGLAKLAAAGTIAGTSTALMGGSSDTSANAATFVANLSEKFLKPILTIIHFFLQ